MNIQLINDSTFKNIKLSDIKKTIFNYGNKVFFSKNGCEYTIYFNHHTNLYVIKIKVPKLQIKYETKRNNLKQVKEFIRYVKF